MPAENGLGRAARNGTDGQKPLHDEGLLEWVGNSPRDPRAYWRLPVD